MLGEALHPNNKGANNSPSTIIRTEPRSNKKALFPGLVKTRIKLQCVPLVPPLLAAAAATPTTTTAVAIVATLTPPTAAPVARLPPKPTMFAAALFNVAV
jgi:hypothetical protein